MRVVEPFISICQSMRRVREEIRQLSKVNISVLVLGESGTGKEVVARQIHMESPRAHRTFLKVNCAALPADLLESELFGYMAGAFTGASHSKPGKFELCDKGTIFLDEVAEMPPALQAKLLHVLQDGEFMRLGARAPTKVDVRVIAATNVNVRDCIEEKSFRMDLYYRLGGFVINLPPLRERPEDIPALLDHFLRKFGDQYGIVPPALPESLIEDCLRHVWPGNVRELENVAKRLLVLSDGTLSNLLPLQPNAPGRKPAAASTSGAEDLKARVRHLKEDAEADAIRVALEQTHWNRKRAALQLGISYKAMLYKVRRYGLDRMPIRPAASVGLSPLSQ